MGKVKQKLTKREKIATKTIKTKRGFGKKLKLPKLKRRVKS